MRRYGVLVVRRWCDCVWCASVSSPPGSTVCASSCGIGGIADELLSKDVVHRTAQVAHGLAQGKVR